MAKSDSLPKIESSDQFLLALDEGVFGAAYRALVGFALIPATHLLLGRDGSDWALIPTLLLALLGLRVGLAVVRKIGRFAKPLQEAWAVRRRLAKQYDAYQWRKLLWIGVGLALYVLIARRYSPGALSLTAFCLAAGGTASWMWRAVMAKENAPPSPASAAFALGPMRQPTTGR